MAKKDSSRNLWSTAKGANLNSNPIARDIEKREREKKLRTREKIERKSGINLVVDRTEKTLMRRVQQLHFHQISFMTMQ